MNKDFTLFKKTFKEYQNRFGLNGYKVYFYCEPISQGDYADISFDVDSHAVSVRLNSAVPKDCLEHRNVAQSAKHEAIHLLTNRLEQCARNRYIREGELDNASEELVYKLETLIK